MDSYERNDKSTLKSSFLNKATSGVTFPDTMSPNDAAAYLGIKTTTLAMWRSTKRYPLSYIKVGRLVQYRRAHLDAFLASRTVDVSE